MTVSTPAYRRLGRLIACAAAATIAVPIAQANPAATARSVRPDDRGGIRGIGSQPLVSDALGRYLANTQRQDTRPDDKPVAGGEAKNQWPFTHAVAERATARAALPTRAASTLVRSGELKNEYPFNRAVGVRTTGEPKNEPPFVRASQTATAGAASALKGIGGALTAQPKIEHIVIARSGSATVDLTLMIVGGRHPYRWRVTIDPAGHVTHITAAPPSAAAGSMNIGGRVNVLGSQGDRLRPIPLPSTRTRGGHY